MWWFQRLKFANVELSAFNGLAITIPRNIINDISKRPQEFYIRFVDAPLEKYSHENMIHKISETTGLNLDLKYTTTLQIIQSMAGVAAYQTFNKEIMHETINKTIPDEHGVSNINKY
ncbi:146_t:CDS:2 [Entrophospora sp. SA101]|nr:146_t:CDS:2 [Entrophospora sp. SA101]